MRVLLVNPPSVARDTSDIAPPLGLYSLAALSKSLGIEVRVWDANVEVAHRQDARLYEDFDAVLDEYSPTVLGVTSMLINSHVALSLLRRGKESKNNLLTVAGGSHFSSFADELVKKYAWVDHVIKGEGEAALELLLRQDTRGRLSPVVSAPVSTALLNSTRPAFEDVPWHLYFRRNDRRLANYETSRGCIYRCTFCYSPGHWGTRPRYVEDAVVLRDLATLAERGVRRLFLVDDNFLNDRARTSRLCGHMRGARTGLRWLCYATLNRLDRESVGELARAGCDSVFVGIDAVGKSAQQEFRKAFFRGSDDALTRLRQCIDAGITPTCALIVRRDAREAELDELMQFAAELRELGCSVRLNPLIGYQGTPFAPVVGTSHYSETRVRLMLDDSPLLRNNSFATADPHLFPYHCSTRDTTEEEKYLREVHVAATLVRHFPETVRRSSHFRPGIWDRIRQISAGVGQQHGPGLRRRERKVAMKTLLRALPAAEAALAAREYAISLLPVRRTWIRCVVAGRFSREVDVRPFVVDETGAAPNLLVAAVDDQVQIFELDERRDRKDLLSFTKVLHQRRRREERIVYVRDETLSALQSAGLLRPVTRKSGAEKNRTRKCQMLGEQA